jgi:hypothetical protein
VPPTRMIVKDDPLTSTRSVRPSPSVSGFVRFVGLVHAVALMYSE